MGGNVSRLMQLTFLTFLIPVVILNKNFFKNYNYDLKNLTFFFIVFMFFAFISGMYGVINNYYNINNFVNLYNKLYSPSALFNVWPRAVGEYIINIYYFIYFSMMTPLIIRDEKLLNYFFNTFRMILIAFLLLGFLDLFAVGFFGYDLIPRHFIDGRYVGFRFHSFAGEPRDAFIYLIYSYFVLRVSNLFNNKSKIDKYLFIIIIISIPLTQSASGLIGIILSLALITFFNINKISLKKILNGLIITPLIILIIYLTIENSYRLLIYKDALFVLYGILDSGSTIPLVLQGQMPNIYPIWDRFLEIKNFNLLPTLLGTGFGSSSVLNNSFISTQEVLNPHSNIIRLFYENGFIGLTLFILAFIKPIKNFNLNHKLINKFIFMMLFILGCFLAHRSSTPYIFLGLLISFNYSSHLSNRTKSQL